MQRNISTFFFFLSKGILFIHPTRIFWAHTECQRESNNKHIFECLIWAVTEWFKHFSWMKRDSYNLHLQIRMWDQRNSADWPGITVWRRLGGLVTGFKPGQSISRTWAWAGPPPQRNSQWWENTESGGCDRRLTKRDAQIWLVGVARRLWTEKLRLQLSHK